MAYEARIRVLDKSIKSKFSHFVIKPFPKFTLPESLKSYLVRQHPAVVAPAQTTNFKMGYFIVGKGNQKFDIVDENTLKQAYESCKSQSVNLWVDPHTPAHTPPKTTTKKRKNHQANQDEDDDEDDDITTPPRAKSTKKQSDVEKVLATLKEKITDYPEFKLRAWAVMVASGTHQSLDVPPNVPFFKKPKEKEAPAQTNNNVPTMSKIEARSALLAQLGSLKKLYDEHVLSEEEYLSQRQKTIDDLGKI